MRRPDYVYFHQDAAVPFFVTRLLTLFLSAILSFGFLWGYGKLVHRDPGQAGYLIILFSVASVLEYAANTLKIDSVPAAVRFYWYVSKLSRSFISYCVYLRSRGAKPLFFAVSLAFLILMIGDVRIGWSEQTVSPETQRDLVATGLTLAVGIVAIFFTVLGLVVQRTMEDYLPSFATLILRNSVYILFFSISLVTALLDLWVLVRGTNPDLVRASVAGSFYCVISVPFLIQETVQNLDVSAVIQKITGRTLKEIRRTIKEQPAILSADRHKNDQVSFTPRMLFSQFLQKWISGSMRPGSAMPIFDVPQDVIVQLQERMRSITNTTLKAITLDQREVVLACLVSMSLIVDGYAKARSSYEGKTDNFFLFMSDQIQIIFNASLKSPNEQYASDVASTVADFAASTLQLTLSIGGGYPENSHVGIFCGVLQTIALRAFQLQHSDASPKACDYLGQLGVSLIAKEAYQPTLFGIADRLQTIGQFVSMQDVVAWPALVCQSSLAQLTTLLHATVRQTIKSQHHFTIASKLLLEKTEAIVETWYEKGHGHLDNQAVTAPLVGGLWTGTKWASTAAEALRGPLNERTASPILEDVSNIVRTLGDLGALAIRKRRTPQYEYFVALSEIGYEAIKFASKSSKDPRIATDAFKLVDKSLHTGVRLVDASSSSPSYQGFEDLFHLSSIWAFLVTSYQETKAARLLEIYAQATEGLISIIEKSLAKGHKSEEFSESYKYIKLFGAWLYRYCPTHKLNKRILLFLAKNHEMQRYGLRRSSYSPMADIGYPTEPIVEAWYIRPSQHWSPEEQLKVTRELNHIPSYKAYDRVVRKLALRLGTFVRFVSRSIP